MYGTYFQAYARFGAAGGSLACYTGRCPALMIMPHRGLLAVSRNH